VNNLEALLVNQKTGERPEVKLWNASISIYLVKAGRFIIKPKVSMKKFLLLAKPTSFFTYLSFLLCWHCIDLTHPYHKYAKEDVDSLKRHVS